jgi:hypothetical protein
MKLRTRLDSLDTDEGTGLLFPGLAADLRCDVFVKLTVDARFVGDGPFSASSSISAMAASKCLELPGQCPEMY